MAERQELLPCPFCGGKAVFIDWRDGECTVDVDHKEGCWIYEDWDLVTDIRISRKDEAIAAWNTRNEPTCKLIYEDHVPHIHIGKWTCSECGGWAMLPPYDLSDATFCPHCGRKVIEVVR